MLELIETLEQSKPVEIASVKIALDQMKKCKEMHNTDLMSSTADNIVQHFEKLSEVISMHMTQINKHFDTNLCKVDVTNERSYRIVALSEMFDIRDSIQICNTIIISKAWTVKIPYSLTRRCFYTEKYRHSLKLCDPSFDYALVDNKKVSKQEYSSLLESIKTIAIYEVMLSNQKNELFEILKQVPKDCEY